MAGKISYEALVSDLKQRKYMPLYLLMGEEPYYIDKVTQVIEETVLTPEERDFNQTVLYGLDANAAQIADMAKRFPMMAPYQVIIVKEAQNLKGWDRLTHYFEHPSPTTILVFCYKNGKLDARKNYTKELSSRGAVFNSEKKRDYEIPVFIEKYLKEKNVSIDAKAKQMVADAVGNDLSRLASELDKTLISIGDSRVVTPEIVESKIGISKDYNFFELRDALVRRDVLKANRIVKYIDSNPKTTSLYAFLPGLFTFFQNLMIAHYTDHSEKGIAAALNFKSTYPARDYVTALKSFGGMKTMQIIHQIRITDAKSKGINNPNTTPGDLLKELVYFILH